MHENIRRFFLVGSLKEDESVLRRKEELIQELEVQMRDNDHVPVLDLEPQFTRAYDAENEIYTFRLTIYGVKEKDAWQVAGISNGKMQTSTTPIKSSLS